MTLRALKRKTSIDPDLKVEEVIKAEFRTRHGAFDLRLSVYVQDDVVDEQRHPTAVRFHARHAVSFLGDPPNGAVTIDLEAAHPFTLRRTPGASPYFPLLNEMHHELILDDEEALRSLAERARNVPPGYVFRLERAALVEEARAGEDGGDLEWSSALSAPDRKGWRKRVEAHRQRSKAGGD